MTRSLPCRVLRTALTTAALAAFLFAMALTAGAANGLEMSTAYPGMTVNAGDDLSFSLDFDNTTGAGQVVSLSVTSLPDGWEGYFTGGSSEISQVYVRSGENEGLADFELTVPEDAADGTYTIGLRAVGEGGASDDLALQMNVTSQSIGESTFEVTYPEQEGSATTTYSFDATIVNNGATEQAYTFSSNLPDGWNISFQPSGDTTQVASLTVGARSSQGVTITVDPADTAEAGTYDISCAAVSANDTLSAELSVIVTGAYSLDLTTPSGLLSGDVEAGKTTTLTLNLVNTGNTDIQQVNLTSTVPDGWTVEFSQPTVEVLEAGATVEVTADVTAGEDALAGDYVVTLSAECSETSDSAEFRMAVQTSTIWGVVGVVLIIVVAGGLALVFHKYGRR